MTGRGLPSLTDLLTLTKRRGAGWLALRIGAWRLRIEGLDASLEASLLSRWGRFATKPGGGPPTLLVGLFDGGPASWLPRWAPGDPYRVEASQEDGSLLVRSHHFGLGMVAAGRWRMAISSGHQERLDRLVENAVRYLVARLAAEAGGLAFHGAAVARDGRAHLLLGPSGSGKTTAVGLLSPAVSLGDDFTAAIPSGGRWVAPSVPFDNLEMAPADRPLDAFPIAGIWRLFQSAEDRVEKPAGVVAASSLMSCVALPWAMPDLTDRILEQSNRLVESVPYAHLHFRKATELHRLIELSI